MVAVDFTTFDTTFDQEYNPADLEPECQLPRKSEFTLSPFRSFNFERPNRRKLTNSLRPIVETRSIETPISNHYGHFYLIDLI